MDYSAISNLPKIDLHCHIDGSLSPFFVKETLHLKDHPDVVAQCLRAPEDCQSLTEYLKCFDLPIKCLQTADAITDGILNILEACASENIVYVELRFAPTFSLNANLSYRDIFESAIKGCKLGRVRYGIESNIIACAMRHLPIETNMAMLHAMADYVNYGICALDLAGDENLFANIQFADLFKEAKRLGIPFTIHSGECGSVDNVRLALEFGARRVGHGIALFKDAALMEACKSNRLGLELCPTSNYQTHAITHDTVYPLRAFLDYGLLATVNTDNRTVSNTTMTKELMLVCDSLEIMEKEISTLYRNSVEISFADDTIKHRLLEAYSWK